MSIEKQRGAKTLTLSLRLDPKTKFILDFLARINGQSITTVVERSIKETADRVGIGRDDLSWLYFWDPNEGVRTLRLYAAEDYPTTFDEDEIRAFTVEHWPFFYKKDKALEPRHDFLGTLWPRIEHYLDVWRETKSSDFWAAGEAMAADLAAARLNPPDWPPKPKPAMLTRASDDEIPF